MLKILILSVLIIEIIARASSQDIFDCRVFGPAFRFLLVNITNESNKTELKQIQDGRLLDTKLKTYFVVHGWREFPTKQLNLKLAETIARHEQSNVILMDYSKWSHKFYTCAKTIVDEAGKALASFVIKAHQANNISLDKVHFNGHSLGSHVAGIAGRLINDAVGARVHRITALDPAGPLFTYPVKIYPDRALRKTDAVIVDVLHTTTLIGTEEQVGSADFYALNTLGPYQPACVDDYHVGCSHVISRKYYIESVESCGIKGVDYKDEESEVTFGHHMPENATGRFKFYPRNKAPFGQYPVLCD